MFMQLLSIISGRTVAIWRCFGIAAIGRRFAKHVTTASSRRTKNQAGYLAAISRASPLTQATIGTRAKGKGAGEKL